MKVTPRIVKLIAEIDEFKGYWKGMKRLSAQRLAAPGSDLGKRL